MAKERWTHRIHDPRARPARPHAFARRTFALGALAASAALVGCGGGLRLTLVDAAHRRPSNVAMYFTVDTSTGEPVGGLEASSFRIYEDGALVSADESKQTILNPEVAAEHYTLLLVDMSGSVTASDQVPLIEQAAASFASTIGSAQKIGVYAFDGSEQIHPIAPFTSATGGAAAAGRISNFRTRDPSTNLHGALVAAVDTLDAAVAASRAPLVFGTIVVFTDGTDRAARVTLGDAVRRLDDASYDVFAIGVGNEIDEGTLGRIGRAGWVRVEDAQALQQAFEDIGRRIVAATRRYYLLSYCSPARAGTHEVTVEAVHGDLTGRVTYEFDATGFGPECDPHSPPPFAVGTQRVGAGRRVQRRADAARPEAAGGARVRAGASVDVRGGAGGDPEAGAQ
jgi:hypothetical protein